jgi:hypothetical protein
LFLLGEGNIEEGRRLLDEGISRAPLATDLAELLDLHIPYIQKIAVGRGHPEASIALEEVKAEVVRRAVEIHVPTPEEELGVVVAELEKRAETDGWDWIGATAGMARLMTEAMQWSEAAEAYRLLLTKGDRFPEADKGLARVALGMLTEGDEKARGGRWSAARDNFREALLLASESRFDEPTIHVELQARIAFMDIELGETDGGKQRLEEALMGPGPGPGIGSLLGDIATSLVMDVGHYWALDDQIQEIEDRVESPDILRELGSLRTSLATVLTTVFQLSPSEAEANLQSNDFQEVAVQIGRGLEGKGEDWATWPMFTSHIPEMRERIQRQTGVLVPGIRVFGSDDLARDEYVIKLHQTPVARGSIQLGMSYVPAPNTSFERIGLGWGAHVEMPNPMTGQSGWWIDSELADSAARTGLDVWPDPAEFVIRHVESVLRMHLGHYLGPDNVRSWFDNWGTAPGLDSEGQVQVDRLATALLVDRASVVRLSRVLRSLVDEMVPVNDRGTIAERLDTVGLRDDDVRGLVAFMRQALKRQLPSNVPGASQVWLPKALEAEMSTWLARDGSGVAFAVPIDWLATVIGRIGSLVKQASADPVIVTRNPEIRPYVRSLLAPTLPTIPVLVSDELVEEPAALDAADSAGAQVMPPVVEQAQGQESDG